MEPWQSEEQLWCLVWSDLLAEQTTPDTTYQTPALISVWPGLPVSDSMRCPIVHSSTPRGFLCIPFSAEWAKEFMLVFSMQYFGAKNVKHFIS